MRKIRLFEHISLDGIIAPVERRAGDSDYTNGGWTAPYRCADGAEATAAAQGERFDLLLGRRTYDLWAGYWPKQTGGLFAERINAATKYVATHRKTDLPWGPAKGLSDDVFAEIRRVKATDGPDLIVWGSTTLTSGLLEHGLADEVVLSVYPLLLGRGKRFFAENAPPHELALVSSTTTSMGVVLKTFRSVGTLRSK